MKSSAAILLSTYNGQEFLREQLDSLLSQDYPDIAIYIRDDGSTDDTRELLREYASRFSHIHVSAGPNLGVVGSFFELLKHVPENIDYTGFCDQDDVWLPDKLTRAVNHLEKHHPDQPCLYFSSLIIVDEALNQTGLRPIPRRPCSFGNALYQNVVPGCTAVINRAALALLQNHVPDLRQVYMHDWWVYLTVSAFGVLEYDMKPGILYRQHRLNALGHKSGFHLWWKRLLLIKKLNWYSGIGRQCEEFWRVYHDILPEQNREILRRFLSDARSPSMWVRLGYAMRGEAYHQERLGNLALRVLTVLGRL